MILMKSKRYIKSFSTQPPVYELRLRNQVESNCGKKNKHGLRVVVSVPG